MRHRIFAHRGLWQGKSNNQNTIHAIRDALSLGFSIETDIRDQNKKIVISHDPPSRNESSLDFHLALALPRSKKQAFALNVKSDGLLGLMTGIEFGDEDFFFDMSFPERYKYLNSGFPVAQRISDFEPLSEVYFEAKVDCKFIWVDMFQTDWPVIAKLENFSSKHKYVFVSPELHGRSNGDFWTWLGRSWNSHSNFYLCTDEPIRFAEFMDYHD